MTFQPIGIFSLLEAFTVVVNRKRWSPESTQILGIHVWSREGRAPFKKVVCVCCSFSTPWTAVHQDPLSTGFSRQGYWSGLPFPSPGDLLNPGIKSGSPALQADSLPSAPPGKPRKKELVAQSAWKKPKCPSTKEWIKKMWYIYTMEYYTAVKRPK